MRKFRDLAVLLVLSCAAGGTQAAGGAKSETESSITVYGGYRTSNQLTETTTGQSVSIHDAASYALALDFGLDRKSQVEFFYSGQKTEMSSGGFSTAANNQSLRIEYYHFGGTYFFDGLGAGGYVVGGIGATVATPEGEGLSSVTKPSLNLGVGYMLPLGKNFGLRFEARGYGTLLNNSGGLFCGGNTGGCVVSIKGNALYQGEALIGLSGRF
jgi:hypothetical protein